MYPKVLKFNIFIIDEHESQNKLFVINQLYIKSIRIFTKSHTMDRSHVHMNPLFLPGKPIRHEIGHVLGLPHVNVRRFLMAQGTSARNQLELSPEESVIMRIMALYRFGGEIIDD